MIGRVLLVVFVLLATLPARAAPSFLPGMDPAPLAAAIAAETPAFTPPAGISGLIVPHHLLAANLIARGFWAASAGHYRRVIVISPDHFRALSTPFGTTRGTLETAFGPVTVDSGAVDALTADAGFVGTLDSLAGEHGIMAIAPFVRHFFPDATIVPILAAIDSTPADWARMAALLTPLATPDTLIVQSTDFSHYRPLSEAIARDQESLAAIDAGDPANVPGLDQPQHLDSKAALFIQLTLQRIVYGASAVVLGNGNSSDYGGGTGSTTSYVVAAFAHDPRAGLALTYPDQSRTLFAGDVLLGRYFAPLLHSPAAWGAIRDAALAATGGAPLIVNLEGVLLDRPVTGVGADAHVMTSDDAAGLLAALQVTAASLANNHANDLGTEGRAETAAQLAALGITPLQHGAVVDMGAFRLLPLNFIRGRFTGDAVADPDALDAVCAIDAAPPLVAFVHWGEEYTTVPRARETAIANALVRCGVSAIIGAHSHQAATAITALVGGASQMLYSLGNFLFDQSSPRGSGTLAELRVFRHGTVALRLIPMPNLFDVGKAALR